jgi:hypothetical protein
MRDVDARLGAWPLKRVAAKVDPGFASQPAKSKTCCAGAASICAQRAAACGRREGGVDALRAAPYAIPTSLRISDCDADLVVAAAREAVGRGLDENRELIARMTGGAGAPAAAGPP